MKVGIIVHSHTGNTLSVAQKIKDQLIEAGHLVDLEQVTAVNEDPSAVANIQLKNSPEASQYDALIFGAPVRGFSLSPVMMVYLKQLSAMKNKKVGCFVTQAFPFEWMGGKRSVGQMKQICESQGFNVFDTGIVNWSSKQREKKITGLLEKMSKV